MDKFNETIKPSKPENQEFLTREEINESFHKSVNELNEFFEIDWKEGLPKLKILDNREEYDIEYGNKTQRWSWGFSKDNGDVCLIAPEKVASETSHTYTPENYCALIKHELCHSFCTKIFHKTSPLWLIEGIAMLTANQNRFKKNPAQFSVFLEHGGNFKPENIYNEAGFAIELLFNKFGKKKILELLYANSIAKSYRDLEKSFQEIFGFEASYDEFNKLLTKQ